MTQNKVRTPKMGKGLAPEIRELAEVYYMSLNCPRSLTMYILLCNNEFDQVAAMKANPLDYAQTEDYHLSALASDLLRKYPGLPVKADPETEAKKSWYQSERECKQANARLLFGAEPATNLLIEVAAEFISDVLGRCPLDLTPRFGPGATVSDPASATTVLDKVSSRPTLTSNANCFLSLWDGTAWERSHIACDSYKKVSYNPEIVEGNTFFTVPKTALTHRGCAKGPSINVAYQLAVGREIRQRLKEVLALDLSKGQAVHNKLACEGSLSGQYATLDCERASDTMSYSVVSALLGKAGLWPDLLKSLREPKTLIDGQWIPLEKFSAMGNGYTFELETLVFLSLCYSVAWAHYGEDGIPGYPGMSAFDLVRSGYISVYGDDVIVPSFMARDVAAVLAALGFTVNLKKSYFEGSFRESCGGDYYLGVSVNTFKLETEPCQPADWFSIHNGLRSRFCVPFKSSEKDVQSILNVVKNQLPRQYRSMYGPTFLGDLVLHGWYGPQISTRARSVYKGPVQDTTDGNQWVARLKVLSPRLVKASFDDYSPEAQLAHFLYTGRSGAPARRPTPRRPLRYEVDYWEGDYFVAFFDYVPRAPRWLRDSPFARFFGLTEDGSYVG